MNLNDFQNLLLNREELEKALGVKINSQTDVFLDDYAMFEYIKLEEVTALFLGLNPNEFKKNKYHPRYFTIFNAIETAVRNNQITAKVDQEFDINGNEYQFDVYLTHDTAKQWAKTHGLKWNIPPYRPLIAEPETIINDHNADEIARLNAIIEQQAETIAGLEAEVENLKKSETAQSVVNYDEFSIYGHTSENIKIAFEIIKKISEKCNPENPHSYPKKDDFVEYIKKYFTDNNSLAQSLYQIIMPEKVKGKGCPPKGVETFQGFI